MVNELSHTLARSIIIRAVFWLWPFLSSAPFSAKHVFFSVIFERFPMQIQCDNSISIGRKYWDRDKYSFRANPFRLECSGAKREHFMVSLVIDYSEKMAKFMQTWQIQINKCLGCVEHRKSYLADFFRWKWCLCKMWRTFHNIDIDVKVAIGLYVILVIRTRQTYLNAALIVDYSIHFIWCAEA